MLPFPELQLDGDVHFRRLDPRDVADLVELRTDAESLRWVDPAGLNPHAARALVSDHGGGLGDRGGTIAIADAESRLLGEISLWRYEVWRASIGFGLRKDARGRGIATTALRALTTWAFESLPELVRVELWVVVGNEPSLRVAERAGYAREGVFRSRYLFGDELRDVVVLSRVRAGR